jgi:hypothetical protein
LAIVVLTYQSAFTAISDDDAVGLLGQGAGRGRLLERLQRVLPDDTRPAKGFDTSAMVSVMSDMRGGRPSPGALQEVLANRLRAGPSESTRSHGLGLDSDVAGHMLLRSPFPTGPKTHTLVATPAARRTRRSLRPTAVGAMPDAKRLGKRRQSPFRSGGDGCGSGQPRDGVLR